MAVLFHGCYMCCGAVQTITIEAVDPGLTMRHLAQNDLMGAIATRATADLVSEHTGQKSTTHFVPYTWGRSGGR